MLSDVSIANPQQKIVDHWDLQQDSEVTMLRCAPHATVQSKFDLAIIDSLTQPVFTIFMQLLHICVKFHQYLSIFVAAAGSLFTWEIILGDFR
jgi:hypothetical protein